MPDKFEHLAENKKVLSWAAAFTQAINILNNLSIYPEYQGVSGLTQLLADTSNKVPGASADAISLFYLGIAGIHQNLTPFHRLKIPSTPVTA